MESINDIELIKKVKAWLKSMLESNGKAWCLSVPPNPNDPDMLISELCERFESLVTPIPFVFEEGLELEGEIFSMYDMSDTETKERT